LWRFIGVEGTLLISGATLLAPLLLRLWMRMPTAIGPNELSLEVLADPEVRLSGLEQAIGQARSPLNRLWDPTAIAQHGHPRPAISGYWLDTGVRFGTSDLFFSRKAR
jgi:hypothetical protein